MLSKYEGRPFAGIELDELRAFLNDSGLAYEDDITFSVIFRAEDGRICATGSRNGCVLKCICVAEKYRGEGLLSALMTALTTQAALDGAYRLFLYTKPQNADMFIPFGFSPVIETDSMLYMENCRGGVARYVASLRAETPGCGGLIGSVVVNCNPFTLGHRQLIERASADCDLLHVFVLSADVSEFPAEARYALVRQGVEDLPNVTVHRTENYIISAATLPRYFLRGDAADAACFTLDLSLFAQRIARPLNITRRYVGSEPFSPFTASYNAAMKALLPRYGISVIEIPRLESDGTAISASAVRRMLVSGSIQGLEKLVPRSTLEYLSSAEGRAVCEKLRRMA